MKHDAGPSTLPMPDAAQAHAPARAPEAGSEHDSVRLLGITVLPWLLFVALGAAVAAVMTCSG